MTPTFANAYALKIQQAAGKSALPPEQLHMVARILQGISQKQGDQLATLVQRWGFQIYRFERFCDYAARPWPMQLSGVSLETFTAEQILEMMYRSAEVWEDGEWRPVELALRRPVSA